MKIAINDNRKISSIQKEFNSIFPYLKLEFFAMPKHFKCDFSKRMLKENSSFLSDCRVIHPSGEISIHPLMTVRNLEKLFFDKYGLGVQVFRKSGTVWLETTVTDGWTLAEQNSQGEALSKLVS